MVEALQKTLSIPSDTGSLKEVRDFVSETLRLAPLNDRDRLLTILGIDEAVTSFVTHRSAGPTEAEIVVHIDFDEVRVRVIIEDRGDDVDPGPLPFGELEKVLRADPTRYLGLFLLRQAMDEVTYRFKKGFQNELELIKFSR